MKLVHLGCKKLDWKTKKVKTVALPCSSLVLRDNRISMWGKNSLCFTVRRHLKNAIDLKLVLTRASSVRRLVILWFCAGCPSSRWRCWKDLLPLEAWVDGPPFCMGAFLPPGFDLHQGEQKAEARAAGTQLASLGTLPTRITVSWSLCRQSQLTLL